jgi:prophage regulatory protein
MKLIAATTCREADTPRVFARLPTVIQVTGLGRSTIYRMVASGAFPAPLQVGLRAVAWRWADLDRWSESRRSARLDPRSARRAQGEVRAQPRRRPTGDAASGATC